ncbi:DNRLRE domain-containing protein [Parafrankia discariae]|uniref:DNRLRE domain-containing protein n=1 Tax=Parafrankia discariae TaxID=365528 RepID=UPI0003A5E0CD|nr:DNRLRE domain-containing protein [Parafrankia discariae]
MRKSRKRAVRHRLAAVTAGLVALGGLTLPVLISPAAQAAPPSRPFTEAPTEGSVRPAPAGGMSGKPASGEVIDLRTATSRTVASTDGVYRTEISSAPIHYKDAGGAWQPIDTALVPAATGGGWQAKAAGYGAAFPGSLADGAVRVSSGDKWVDMRLRGSTAQGSVQGSTVTYKNALPGVTLVYTVLPTGVKESLVLDSASAATTYPFAITPSAGLTAKLDHGRVAVSGTDGKPVFTLPAAFAEDRADNLSGRDAVASTLRPATEAPAPTATATATPAPSATPGPDPLPANATVVTQTVAKDWLADRGRSWPVTVDPTVTIGPSQITDCYVVDGPYATANYCSSGLLEIGHGGSPNGVVKRRTLMNFDLSAIPKYAVVATADIKLTVTGASSPSPNFPVYLHRLSQSWTTAATWNNSGSGAWTGGTWAGAAYDVKNVTGTPGEFDIYAGKLAQDWVNGTVANQGLILKADESTQVGVVQFASTQATNAAQRPSMVVDWTSQTGSREFNTFVGQKLDSRCDANVNVGNGNLLLQCAEYAIGGVGRPLTVSRFYNSGEAAVFQNAGDTPLGLNRWKLSTGVSILENGNGASHNGATFHDEAGTPYVFESNGGLTYTTPPGLNAKLEKNQPATGQYRLTFDDSKTVYVFKKFTTDPLNLVYQLWKATDRNGNTTTFDYAARPGYAEGFLSTIKDTRGRITQAAYTNEPTSGKDFLTSLADTHIGRAATYHYAGWNLDYSTDPGGEVRSYDYTTFGSANGELSKFWDPDGRTTDFTYDTAGRVLTITRHPSAGVNLTTTFAYNDAATPPTRTVTDPRSKATVYTVEHRDYGSRVTAVEDADGNDRSTTWTAQARVGSVTNAIGGTFTNTWGYNNGGSLTATAGPLGATTKYGYVNTDPACPAATPAPANPQTHQPMCSSDPAANRSLFTFDGPGNITANENAFGAEAQISYNPDGQPAASTDPNGNATTYTYGTTTYNGVTTKQLLRVNPPAGNSLAQRWVYFDNGERVRQIVTGTGVTVDYSYTNNDRLTEIDYSDTTTDITFDYDHAGNLTERVDASGTTTYAYDGLSRLTSMTLPGGSTTSYTYDGASNLLTVTELSGTTTYTYDDVNNVATMIDRAGNRTVFGYDADSRRVDTWASANTSTPPTTFAMHTHTTFDTGGRLKRIRTTRASSDADANRVMDYEYCYSPYTSGTCTTSSTTDRNQIQGRKDLATGFVATYTYDTAGRLTRFNNGAADDFVYTYDATGNRLSARKGTGATTYYGYNSGNQHCWTTTTNPGASAPCSPLPSGGVGNFTYNGEGSQTRNQQLYTLAYNGANQQTSTTVTSGGPATSYSYAGDTNVLRTQAGGTSFRNGLLGVHSLTTGGQTTHVARDPAGGLISLLVPSGGSTTTYHYVYDGQANVVGLIDGSGAERARYTYGPYGEAATATAVGGTLPTNPYRFAGAYLDDTGQYKIGLRYYNPNQATWTQTDSVVTIDDPTRANPYTYAGGDPANNLDPTGALFGDIKDVFTDPDLGDVLSLASDATSLAAPFFPPAGTVSMALSGAAAVSECTIGSDGECGKAVAGAAISFATFGSGAFIKGSLQDSYSLATNIAGAGFSAYGLMS